MKRLSKTATAYHEAGHAVAASCLGIKLAYVTIFDNEVSNGHLMLDSEQVITFLRSVDICQGDRWDPSRLVAEKWVMVYQAGEVAHRRHRFPSPVRRDHFQSDRSGGFEILRWYARDEEERDVVAHHRLLCTWTVSLIVQNWNLVEATAKALLESGMMSADQILEVIRGIDGEQHQMEVRPLLDFTETAKRLRDRNDK